MSKTKPLKFSNARQLVEKALDLVYFTDDNPPIPFVYDRGEDPLVVVTGENAGGKSFLRRIFSQMCRENEIEAMPISMEGRRNVSYSPWLAFVYGDEMHEATGVNSIRTVVTGIKTCQGREAPHVIIWDEPDLGLSEGNAASVGRAIAEYIRKPNKHTKASVVITHRKALVAELVDVNPHYVYLGSQDGPPTLREWLDAPPVIRPLEDVLDDGIKRMRAIQKILDGK